MRRLGGIGIVIALAVALAPAQPPATSTADEQTLTKAHIATDGPSLVAFFKARVVPDVDRQRLANLVRQLGDDSYAIRERASTELATAGLPAVALLRKAASDPDVEIARRAERCLKQIERVPTAALTAAAARLMAQRKPAGGLRVLLDYLPSADDPVVAEELREAICTLAVVNGMPDPLLTAALDDQSPARRGAAVVALVRTGRPDAIAAAGRALADGSVDVRRRAAIALVTRAKDRSAVPALIGLLAELPPAEAWPVQELLGRMAGENSPRTEPGTDEAARRKNHNAWQEWWAKHGAATDLAKLDTEPGMLGLTLVVVQRNRAPVVGAGGIGAVGAVLELDPANTVTWRIDGLPQPVDAVVLGRDRVAIAEQGSQRVTVRDFQGTEIWGASVQVPNTVQRTHGGTLFVCGRGQLTEYDPAVNFRVVYEYKRPATDMVAAFKSRSGEVTFVTFTGEVIRLDVNRNQIKSFRTQPGIGQIAGLEVLANGNLLKTAANAVVEYGPDGGPIRWQAGYSRPASVQRLSNGNTLVCGNGGVAELDKDYNATKKPIWEYRPADGLAYRARRR